MLRNYFFINILLLALTGLLGFKLYGTLSYKMEMPVAAKQEKKEGAPPRREEKVVLNEAPFQVISRLDLFRPTRSPAPPVSMQQAAPKVPPRLFGTVILNNEKSAILEDPGTKLTRAYRVNDSIAGFVVSDILEDKVVLKSDGDRVEVRLREVKKGIVPKGQPMQRPAPHIQPQGRPQTPPQNRRPIPRPAPPPPAPQPQMPPEFPSDAGENINEPEPEHP